MGLLDALFKKQPQAAPVEYHSPCVQCTQYRELIAYYQEQEIHGMAVAMRKEYERHCQTQHPVKR
jgi:hypothetical protein